MRKGLIVSALLAAGAGLGSCNVAGPAALSSGRSVYNSVISATEDEQVLAMLVRKRYDESFGMLSVASVTATIKVGASLGTNVGFGPSSDYAGNLVPLSGGLTYEENPTISYVPLQGEVFITKMLAPITLEQALLLGGAHPSDTEVLRLVIRRINGVSNPLFDRGADPSRFDEFIRLYTSLRDGGFAQLMRNEHGETVIVFHDLTPERAEAARELFGVLGVDASAAPGTTTTIPMCLAIGAPSRDRIQIQTPSALEIITAIAEGVTAPEAHLETGIARTVGGDAAPFIRIEPTRQRPKDALVAVAHRGWWFSIDARDTASKQGFMLLRILIGMRLDDATAGSQAPVLTLPVGG